MMTGYSNQIPYLFLEEEAPKMKLKQPKKVVSNRRGPLFLRTESSSERKDKASKRHSSLPDPAHHLHPHKRTTLNRYPVKAHERPMELVERQLGTMSCAQLKQSIENWLPESDVRCIRLPRLQLPLDSTAVEESSQHGPLPRPPSQHATLPACGSSPAQQTGPNLHDAPMNVTITYNTRHRQHQLPRMSPQQSLDSQPTPTWTKHLSTPLQDHAPTPIHMARLPHPSLGVPEGISALLVPQHATQTPTFATSRRVNRRSHHTHRLRPLLSHTLTGESGRLSIAQQARLNSPRRYTLQLVKGKTTH